MHNILDYIRWRGDISIEKSELNEADALALSMLAYIPFEEIITYEINKKTTLKSAAEQALAKHWKKTVYYHKSDIKLLDLLSRSERFGNMKLSGYTNTINSEKQMQFSAITIELGNGAVFIAFRGTDDSLAGWKEDFNMSFMTPVPSQMEAAKYLNRSASAFSGPIITGGHSKGGNLAVYAAAFCRENIQRRIVKIYNNDGPGFDFDTLSKTGYQKVKNRIKTFLPQQSVIGMLLEHEEEYCIIRSNQIGILQHDPYSWEVEGNNFVYLDKVSDGSRFIDRTLKEWIYKMNKTQREQFVDSLYSALEKTKARTTRELSSKWLENTVIIMKSLSGMEEETKQSINKAVLLLFKCASENFNIVLRK